jgi:biopolymer transport protein ExbB/TolQ
MEGLKTAFDLNNGGIWMWLIALMSIICLALIVERTFFIVFRYNANAKNLMDAVQRYVLGDRIDDAIRACNAAGNAAIAQVVKAGLTRANKNELEIQNAIEEATLEVVPMLQKNLGIMAAFANIATLLGLLGTIIGLIDAFAALQSATPDKRQEMLSRGIAIAMNTTAFGLIVAIPTLIFHTILSAVVKHIMEDINLYSTKLANMLSARVK